MRNTFDGTLARWPLVSERGVNLLAAAMAPSVLGIGGFVNGGNHLVIGAGSTAVVLWGLSAAGAPIDIVTIGVGSIVAGLGALMPDIDHPRATASSALPRELMRRALSAAVPLAALALFFGVMGGKSAGTGMLAIFAPYFKLAGVLALAAIAFFALSAIVRAFSEHRGMTHSLVFAAGATIIACVGCAIFSVPVWYGLLFGWGWLTHLGADATTSMGLPSLFWPFDSSGATAAPISLESRVAQSVATHVATTVPSTQVTPVGESTPVVFPVRSQPEAPLCPSCGVPMVLRTARRGGHLGEQFYGCANYPKCRQMRSPG